MLNVGTKIYIPIVNMTDAITTVNNLKAGNYTVTCDVMIDKAYIENRHIVIELANSQGTIEFKRKYNKRSLDANAYCWHLIGEIADALNVSKDIVYIIMLKRYGQGGVAKIKQKDEEAFKKQVKYWERHERLTDENASYFRFWVGSSNYNTREMSVFIDGIVSECKELGIETMTPSELARMKAEW